VSVSGCSFLSEGVGFIPKSDYLVFSTSRDEDSERVEERSSGFRVEKTRS
jgi:hypothetical protein